MNLKKIKALELKVRKQAQSALDKIYKSHDRQLIKLIKSELKKEQSLLCYNGMTRLLENGKNIDKGRAWGFNSEENEQLNYISLLQYHEEFKAGFSLPDKIDSYRRNHKQKRKLKPV